jgi:hypothetical protein
MTAKESNMPTRQDWFEGWRLFALLAQALGAGAWRLLHLVGGYYLLFQFIVSFGKRIPDMPLYALFLIPLAVVFAPRMISMAAARTPRRVLTG